MYSHRYGTLPLVTCVGGLADTVIDPGQQIGNTDQNNKANGFVIDTADTDALAFGMQNVIKTFNDKHLWLQMQRNAMQLDYSWSESASHYIDMYKKIVQPA